MPDYNKEPCEVFVSHVVTITNKAVLLKFDTNVQAWIPISQIEEGEPKPFRTDFTITIPHWLVEQEGLEEYVQ